MSWVIGLWAGGSCLGVPSLSGHSCRVGEGGTVAAVHWESFGGWQLPDVSLQSLALIYILTSIVFQLLYKLICSLHTF